MEAMEKSGMQINYLDEAGLQAFKDATSGILAEFAPDWCGMDLIEKAQSYNG